MLLTCYQNVAEMLPAWCWCINKTQKCHKIQNWHVFHQYKAFFPPSYMSELVMVTNHEWFWPVHEKVSSKDVFGRNFSKWIQDMKHKICNCKFNINSYQKIFKCKQTHATQTLQRISLIPLVQLWLWTKIICPFSIKFTSKIDVLPTPTLVNIFHEIFCQWQVSIYSSIPFWQIHFSTYCFAFYHF